MKAIKKKYVIAILAFAFLLSFQGLLIYNHYDSWPFSQYPMFSNPKLDSNVSTYKIDFELKNGKTLVLPWKGDRVHTVIMRDFVESTADKLNPILKNILQDYAQSNSIPLSEIAQIRLVKLNSKLDENNKIISNREIVKFVTL